jgi:hypothetical protein
MSKFITAQELPSGYIIPERKDEWPKPLAQLFCSMDSEQQALFFDEVAEIDEKHFNRKGVFQWRHMMNFLTDRAKRTIDEIKDHTDEIED